MFVDQLDWLSLGFESVNAKLTGRPGYHPATILKLYIYGDLNRIQSSRRLEKAESPQRWINVVAWTFKTRL
jgi:transposase